MIKSLIFLMFIFGKINLAYSEDSIDKNSDFISRSFELSYRDLWIAERSDVKVSLFDLQGRLQEIPGNDRLPVLSSPERIAQILNDLLFNYKLAEGAVDRGLLNDKEIQAEIFYQAMLILARHENAALFAENELDDYRSRAEEYYLANPTEFSDLEQLTFTHVLFRAPSAMKAESFVLANLLMDALSNPSSLDSIELSDFKRQGVTSSRSKIEKISPSRLDARFAAGLAKMLPGDVAVVESSFGAHVVRLDARSQGGTRSFEEVRPMLEERARQRHHDQILRQRMEAFYAAPLNLAEGAVERIIQSQAPASDD